jgi:hypothetical protein
MVGQVFDSAIGAAYPEAAAAATPVTHINMHSEGKYAFVEMATEDMATAAMQLDKLELCGRSLNVARPSGYVDPAARSAQEAALVNALLPSPHGGPRMTTLFKVDTNCTAPSLIPTVNGNTVRSFSTHGQQSAAKGSSTTVSRSDIRLIQHLDS